MFEAERLNEAKLEPEEEARYRDGSDVEPRGGIRVPSVSGTVG